MPVAGCHLHLAAGSRLKSKGLHREQRGRPGRARLRSPSSAATGWQPCPLPRDGAGQAQRRAAPWAAPEGGGLSPSSPVRGFFGRRIGWCCYLPAGSGRAGSAGPGPCLGAGPALPTRVRTGVVVCRLGVQPAEPGGARHCSDACRGSQLPGSTGGGLCVRRVR